MKYAWLVVLSALCLVASLVAAQQLDEGPDVAPQEEAEPAEPQVDAGPAPAPAAVSGRQGTGGAEGVDAQAPSITEEEVEAAIQLKVKYLYSIQNDEGHWESGPEPQSITNKEDRNYGGRSGLVVLALLYAGEDYKDERIRKGIVFLSETNTQGTYGCGIRAGIWSKIKDQKFRELLKREADFLMAAATQTNGTINGFFSYGKPGHGSGDHSNSQYGVLGLRDAAIRGIEIPFEFWEAIEKHMCELQAPDGGWSYRTVPGGWAEREPYGNMTVACLANLYITYDRLQAKYQVPCFTNKTPRRHQAPDAIERGKMWLDNNLAAGFGYPVPGKRGMNLYYLYGLERCANASGRKMFGGINWFEEGAKWIIKHQAANGSHSQYGIQPGTSWALLFLCKGRGPVLFNKLDYGPGWNIYPLDIPNLSDWCGDELEQRVNWQVVDIKDDVRTWLDAPVLYFNGLALPEFTDEQKKKLRLYTDSGGTLVAEAVCSKPEFVRAFMDLAKEVWPEWELQLLDRKHPVMDSHFTVTGTPRKIFHLHDGCRSRVFLIAQDMSCAWNQRLLPKYKHFFQFGMNLARYASDKRMLRSRLYFRKWELDELRAQGKPVPEVSDVRGKLRLADWPTDGRRLTDVRALRHLRETLDEAHNVTLQTLKLQDHDLGNLDGVRIVHMSGHHTFVVSDENIAKLRAFIDGGGLIWADAHCGREAFNESFPKFLARLLPGAELRDVAGTDPLLTGKGLPRDGFDVVKIRYKRALKFNLFQPVLKEVWHEGRRVIVYSPHDLTCGLDGHFCWDCRGPERNDCLKMAANICLSMLREGDVDRGPADPAAAPPVDVPVAVPAQPLPPGQHEVLPIED